LAEIGEHGVNIRGEVLGDGLADALDGKSGAADSAFFPLKRKGAMT